MQPFDYMRTRRANQHIGQMNLETPVEQMELGSVMWLAYSFAERHKRSIELADGTQVKVRWTDEGTHDAGGGATEYDYSGVRGPRMTGSCNGMDFELHYTAGYGRQPGLGGLSFKATVDGRDASEISPKFDVAADELRGHIDQQLRSWLSGQIEQELANRRAERPQLSALGDSAAREIEHDSASELSL
jgi:hypothetical protein